MEELILPRPKAGEHIVIESTPCANIVAQFSTEEFMLDENGEDLLFAFDDGSSLILKHFYSVYSPEVVPDFVIDDVVLDGSFFFTMREELMPEVGGEIGVAAMPGIPESVSSSELVIASHEPIRADVEGLDVWSDADMASYLLHTTGIL